MLLTRLHACSVVLFPCMLFVGIEGSHETSIHDVGVQSRAAARIVQSLFIRVWCSPFHIYIYIYTFTCIYTYNIIQICPLGLGHIQDHARAFEARATYPFDVWSFHTWPWTRRQSWTYAYFYPWSHRLTGAKIQIPRLIWGFDDYNFPNYDIRKALDCLEHPCQRGYIQG